VRVWGKARRSQICKQFAAVECFSTQVYCLSPYFVSPIPPKTIRIYANHMTQHGWGRVGTCLPVATLLIQIKLFTKIYVGYQSLSIADLLMTSSIMPLSEEGSI